MDKSNLTTGTLTTGTKAGMIMRLAIVFTALPDTGAGSALPVLELMMQDMPTVNPTWIQMVFTMPSLCLIIFPPLYAKLTEYVSRRNLLIIAMVCFTIGSFGPVFSNSIEIILIFRFILGIGAGIVNPITVDMAVHYFDGHDQRRMLGICYACTSVGGILYQTVGGILGAGNWHMAFWANLIAFPFFLFSCIFLPKEKPKRQTKTPDMKIKKEPLTYRESILLSLGGVNEMCLYVLTTCASTYIIAGGYGNAAVAGAILSVFMAGGLIMGPLYPYVFRLFGRYTMVFGCAMLFLGLFSYAVGDGIIYCAVGALLCGFAQGSFLPGLQFTIAQIAPLTRKSTAVSLTYTARGLGGFLSPYVFAVIYSLTGTQIGRPSFAFGSVVVALLCVALIFAVRKIVPKTDGLEA